MIKLATTLFLLIVVGSQILYSQDSEDRGMYFAKKVYDGSDLPVFSESKDKLPVPKLEQNKEWIDMYWKCWELAFKHFKKPPENSPFVSNILDEAFNKNIFQWDMIFMVMFARYGDHVFPAVSSLDNFYCRQHSSGYICREISELDGSDFVYGGRVNTINPPLFSWAEVESFKNTGDKSRFKLVMPVLEKYVAWLNQDGDLNDADDEEKLPFQGRRAANSKHKLYWNTPLGSGMDNTPRQGTGWVDMSCQMVIQYNNLAQMCQETGANEKAKYFMKEASKIGKRINKYCWNEKDGLYYDVDEQGNQVKWKTSGCFWPMLAGIASKKQCQKLAANLTDTSSFWRKNVFPTLAADQEQYDPKGYYWLGSVWAPTNYAIIKGLEKNGLEELARKASEKYLSQMYCVFDSTHTVWENYSPDYCEPGNLSKSDFVGWSGIGPISLLIENILGFRVNASQKTLTWIISRNDEHGIENLMVGDIKVSLLCKKRKDNNSDINIVAKSDKSFNLVVLYGDHKKEFSLEKGEYSLKIEY